MDCTIFIVLRMVLSIGGVRLIRFLMNKIYEFLVLLNKEFQMNYSQTDPRGTCT